MKMIISTEYKDGIAFYIDGCEIAFYSNITNRIEYNDFGIRKTHSDYKTYGCISLPIEENIYIINEVQKYIEKTKKGDGEK